MSITRQVPFTALVSFAFLTLSQWNVSCGDFPQEVHYLEKSGVLEAPAHIFSDGSSEYCSKGASCFGQKKCVYGWWCEVYKLDHNAENGYVLSHHGSCYLQTSENEAQESLIVLKCEGCEQGDTTRELVRVNAGDRFLGTEKEIKDKDNPLVFIKGADSCTENFIPSGVSMMFRKK